MAGSSSWQTAISLLLLQASTFACLFLFIAAATGLPSAASPPTDTLAWLCLSSLLAHMLIILLFDWTSVSTARAMLTTATLCHVRPLALTCLACTQPTWVASSVVDLSYVFALLVSLPAAALSGYQLLACMHVHSGGDTNNNSNANSSSEHVFCNQEAWEDSFSIILLVLLLLQAAHATWRKHEALLARHGLHASTAVTLGWGVFYFGDSCVRVFGYALLVLRFGVPMAGGVAGILLALHIIWYCFNTRMKSSLPITLLSLLVSLPSALSLLDTHVERWRAFAVNFMFFLVLCPAVLADTTVFSHTSIEWQAMFMVCMLLLAAVGVLFLVVMQQLPVVPAATSVLDWLWTGYVPAHWSSSIWSYFMKDSKDIM